ncbi:MAG: DUF429 domain-containing protein [Chloroflexi bacterium]|nr:DUF429 domain-containing protein [Chloroflexota bacterium]
MTAPAFTLAGIDGCKGGWIAVMSDDERKQIGVMKAATVAEILATVPTLETAAVDIPIGLPTETCPVRQCDVEARRILGRAAPRVFFAPQKFLLGARSHREAVKRCNTKLGPGHALSIQAFGILPRIEEVDRLVRTNGQGVVKEVHPEIAFWEMAGEQVLPSKHSAEGITQRRDLLGSEFGPTVVEECSKQRHGTHAKVDDLYDALAALWSARRISEGKGKRLPEHPEKDSEGLVMEINY